MTQLRNIDDLVKELGQYAQKFVDFQQKIGSCIYKIIKSKNLNICDINKELPSEFPDMFWVINGNVDLKIKDILLLEDILGEKIIEIVINGDI